MKIPPSIRPSVDPLAIANVAKRPSPPPVAARDAAPRDGSALSSAGALVTDLRAQAAAHGVEGDVRPDVVARMKQEIADGRLGTPEDIERAVDALLREL